MHAEHSHKYKYLHVRTRMQFRYREGGGWLVATVLEYCEDFPFKRSMRSNVTDNCRIYSCYIE